MNLQEAQEILKLKSLETSIKRNFRDHEERMRFLQKWSKKYLDELAEIKHHHAQARESLKNLPTVEQVKEAARVCDNVASVDKEIRRLKKRKEKMHHGKRN